MSYLLVMSHIISWSKSRAYSKSYTVIWDWRKSNFWKLINIRGACEDLITQLPHPVHPWSPIDLLYFVNMDTWDRSYCHSCCERFNFPCIWKLRFCGAVTTHKLVIRQFLRGRIFNLTSTNFICKDIYNCYFQQGIRKRHSVQHTTKVSLLWSQAIWLTTGTFDSYSIFTGQLINLICLKIRTTWI